MRGNILPQRMATMAISYEEAHPPKESPHKARLNKMIQDLVKFSPHIVKTSDHIEKTLTEMSRLLNPRNPHIDNDQHILRQAGGVDVIVKICANELTPIGHVICSH